MRKYLLVMSILVAVVVGTLFVRHAILAPARAAAFNLAAINGITVGQTTEAELLRRTAFQTVDRECYQADCFYHMETENKFLGRLHLAPDVYMSTGVSVTNGLVTGVLVFTMKTGQPAISFRQPEKMPSGCNSDPCVQRLMLPNKTLTGISIQFSSASDLRNHVPELVNSECFSRLHGCKTAAEFVPITKNMNLEAAAH
jgi:hypothetical protein